MKVVRILRFGPPNVITNDDLARPELAAGERKFQDSSLATKCKGGTVLPLEEARIAHEMLEGAPHKRGKIVLRIAD